MLYYNEEKLEMVKHKIYWHDKTTGVKLDSDCIDYINHGLVDVSDDIILQNIHSLDIQKMLITRKLSFDIINYIIRETDTFNRPESFNFKNFIINFQSHLSVEDIDKLTVLFELRR